MLDWSIIVWTTSWRKHSNVFQTLHYSIVRISPRAQVCTSSLPSKFFWIFWRRRVKVKQGTDSPSSVLYTASNTSHWRISLGARRQSLKYFTMMVAAFSARQKNSSLRMKPPGSIEDQEGCISNYPHILHFQQLKSPTNNIHTIRTR